MAVNYIVQAEVVDIRSDHPKKDDIFLVDTNVWYWLTYTKASTSAKYYQITDYPTYIAKALSAQSLLLYCGLSLSELAHNIEQNENKIFSSTLTATLTAKEYRHNYSAERTNVVAEIQAAWSQVTSIAVSTDIIVDEATTNSALTRFSTQPLDGYDLLILAAMENAGIIQVITDDGDYVTVPGIRVFTGNQNVIIAARNQSKLLIR
ncbi:PIN domain-containing protein [Argonema antarcticum]|uniref:PIN domain-containing protein n=1 Tax=Argonema antarcticum TaxID=2942763 RepID=UPI002011D369|nr:PIN domain-containing protein [Argonema antarcticum]MCL1475676.1 PIN domain-containing protein [Argonema antarcticum A004/B2]